MSLHYTVGGISTSHGLTEPAVFMLKLLGNMAYPDDAKTFGVLSGVRARL